MKVFFCIYLFVLAIGFSACGSKGRAPEVESSAEINTSISFVATELDLGQVWEGNKVVSKFEFENTGNANLIIHNVRASCGCTTPKFEKKPIRPGNKSVIEVAFDTRGRPGRQRQTIVVSANTEPANTNLAFTCEVVPPIRPGGR